MSIHCLSDCWYKNLCTELFSRKEINISWNWDSTTLFFILEHVITLWLLALGIKVTRLCTKHQKWLIPSSNYHYQLCMSLICLHRFPKRLSKNSKQEHTGPSKLFTRLTTAPAFWLFHFLWQHIIYFMGWFPKVINME